jgi:hypothetical protein
MATINNNYLKLKAGYLFPEIARLKPILTHRLSGWASAMSPSRYRQLVVLR